MGLVGWLGKGKVGSSGVKNGQLFGINSLDFWGVRVPDPDTRKYGLIKGPYVLRVAFRAVPFFR